MDLSECMFFRSGKDVNFSVFSDDISCSRFLRTVPLPIGGDVDVYEIEPGPKSNWILIRQTENGKETLRWFVRKDESFLELGGNIPNGVLREAGQKFPQLVYGNRALVA